MSTITCDSGLVHGCAPFVQHCAVYGQVFIGRLLARDREQRPDVLDALGDPYIRSVAAAAEALQVDSQAFWT